jgi:hypothetical protein
LKLLLVVQEKEVLVKNIKRRMQYWHARKVELEQEEQVRYNCRASFLEGRAGLAI